MIGTGIQGSLKHLYKQPEPYMIKTVETRIIHGQQVQVTVYKEIHRRSRFGHELTARPSAPHVDTAAQGNQGWQRDASE